MFLLEAKKKAEKEFKAEQKKLEKQKKWDPAHSIPHPLSQAFQHGKASLMFAHLTKNGHPNFWVIRSGAGPTSFGTAAQTRTSAPPARSRRRVSQCANADGMTDRFR